MSGTKPGDAIADRVRDEFDRNRREREVAIERLMIRIEMRAAYSGESTDAICRRAEERVASRAKSDPPPKAAKGIAYVISSVTTPLQAVVALSIVASLVASVVALILRDPTGAFAWLASLVRAAGHVP